MTELPWDSQEDKGVKVTLVMVHAGKDARIYPSDPLIEDEKARIYIGDDVVLWLHPQAAARLHLAIDEAVAKLVSP